MNPTRRPSRKVTVGWVDVGGDAPIRVQSMCTTKTADVNATLQQMAALVAAGCEIVRVAVPHWEDAEALKAIAEHATIPVIADIHFQWKYAMAALEAGIHGLRINPGNIKYQDKARLIAREAKDRGVPIRIGVNAGSLEKDLLEKYGNPTAEALVESALSEMCILEDKLVHTELKSAVNRVSQNIAAVASVMMTNSMHITFSQRDSVRFAINCSKKRPRYSDPCVCDVARITSDCRRYVSRYPNKQAAPRAPRSLMTSR